MNDQAPAWMLDPSRDAFLWGAEGLTVTFQPISKPILLVSHRSHTESAFYIVIFYFSTISIKSHDTYVKNVFYATVLYFMTQVLQFLFVLVTLLLNENSRKMSL